MPKIKRSKMLRKNNVRADTIIALPKVSLQKPSL